MTEDILLLGHPLLRKKAEPVPFPWDDHFPDENARLKRALEEFRREKGFGRGIAAPQIGISKCLVSLNLGEGSFSIINPVITQRSEETFTLWDDCMSFPDLLVKVERAVSITVEYRDEAGKEQRWEVADRSLAELLQHEIDHLEGILAIDRDLDRDSIVYRSVFEKDKEYFQSLL